MIWIPIIVVGIIFLIFYSYVLTAVVYTSGFIGILASIIWATSTLGVSWEIRTGQICCAILCLVWLFFVASNESMANTFRRLRVNNFDIFDEEEELREYEREHKKSSKKKPKELKIVATKSILKFDN